MKRKPALAPIRCPLCKNVWQTSQTTPVIACTKCHKTFPNPLSKNPGKFVTCTTCGHKWCTSVKKGSIRCPNCSVTIKCEDDKIPSENIPESIGRNQVTCGKCGYQWQYNGKKNAGELDECPNCKKLTPINVVQSKPIPTNKPKIFTTTIRVGELHLKYTEPEIQALLNRYHLTNTQATETAVKLFLLWIEMVENHNFSKEDLLTLKQVLQESDLTGLIPVIDKRLEFLEKSHRKKLIFGFGGQKT